MRLFFGRRVLRAEVDSYIMGKYRAHVEHDEQWPPGSHPRELTANRAS